MDLNSVKIAYCLTHPIQYQSPLVRHLRASGLDIEVLYHDGSTSGRYHDKGFNQSVEWDVPLLEGYPYHFINDFGSTQDSLRTRLDKAIKARRWDCVWVHGWAHPFCMESWKAAKRHSLPLLLRAETFAGCVRGGILRRAMHRFWFSRQFRNVSAFLAVGKLNADLYRSYGVPDEKIFPVPYVVDNEFFRRRVLEARPKRELLRKTLGIASKRPIVLFTGKLIGVKNPQLLIDAFLNLKQTSVHRPVLLMVGEGNLRNSLESQAGQILGTDIFFTGFRNQTELPGLYDLCDLFVLPSRFEPWGLVVNEVMNAGKPIIVSNQVGAGPDLVLSDNGWIFPTENSTHLTELINNALSDPDRLVKMGDNSFTRISGWGFGQAANGLATAIQRLQS